jgi:hypothetical protein
MYTSSTRKEVEKMIKNVRLKNAIADTAKLPHNSVLTLVVRESSAGSHTLTSYGNSPVQSTLSYPPSIETDG